MVIDLKEVNATKQPQFNIRSINEKSFRGKGKERFLYLRTKTTEDYKLFEELDCPFYKRNKTFLISWGWGRKTGSVREIDLYIMEFSFDKWNNARTYFNAHHLGTSQMFIEAKNQEKAIIFYLANCYGLMFSFIFSGNLYGSYYIYTIDKDRKFVPLGDKGGVYELKAKREKVDFI